MKMDCLARVPRIVSWLIFCLQMDPAASSSSSGGGGGGGGAIGGGPGGSGGGGEDDITIPRAAMNKVR